MRLPLLFPFLAVPLLAAASESWIEWNPPRDDFKSSAIDLRSLNEKFAGEGGQIVARGEEFIHSKTQKPVRFWAVNGPPRDEKDLGYSARALAKYGVNLVRLHGGPYEAKTGELKPERVREVQEAVQAMKKEGIYSLLSIYFPLWLEPENGPGWREGYEPGTKPFALLYFEPEFQELYQSWWKAILTEPGPDGKKLVNDPAVMGLEIVNEDSFFFWTFNEKNIPLPHLLKLEKMFGEWAAKKYGSPGKALAAWKGSPLARDDAGSGRLAFRPLFDIFTWKTPRDLDTASFLLELQRGFYAGTVKFLRGLGYKGMITASNWTTANNDVLGPLEKFSYTVGDFIDRHGYFGCNHKGEFSAWSIRVGQTYSNVSSLRFEAEEPGKPKVFSNPAMDPMYNRMPSMISEIAWNRPNKFRGEAPLFDAVYGALQGTDGIVHFAFDSPLWKVKPGFFMQPWTLMSPTQAGQFPAAARIYRQGLVKPGDVMADFSLKIGDMMALKGTPLVQRANLDELRKADAQKGQDGKSSETIDPLIHFVGRTNITFSNEAGKSEVRDLAKFIDRDAQSVTSSTGELKLDFGIGLLTVNAPAAQAASGDLKAAGEVRLRDISIASDLTPGHIVAVALDDKPLATSSNILLQVMSEEKASGFTTEPAGDNLHRITNIGQDPWLFKPLQGTVQFKRPDARQMKATALDFNGNPTGQAGTAEKISLQPGTAYYLIEK